MAKLNKAILVSLVVLIFVGICVSRVKYEVVFLRNRLKDINMKIEKYSDDLRVYGAEWSYLNQPKRLKKLCEKYLKNLRPTENKQILSYESILESDFEQNQNNAFGSFLDQALENDEMEDR